MSFHEYSLVADHWTYHALPALAALLAAAIISLGRTASHRLVCTLAVALALAVLTGVRAHRYADPAALWRDNIDKHETCWVAHNNYGIHLIEAGNAQHAERHFRRAIELRKDYARAHLNLGRLLAKTDRLDEGIQHLKTSIEIGPPHDEAYKFLGIALTQANRFDEAMIAYADAANRDPYDTETRLLIAQTLERVNQHAEAVAWYYQALELTPHDVVARYLYAQCLLKLNRHDDARAELRIAQRYAAHQGDTQSVQDLQAAIDALD